LIDPEQVYRSTTSASRALHERAVIAMPGGTTRTTTYFDPYPLYIDRGDGCRVWDVDGTERIDMLGNYTAMILGHAHPKVVEAIHKQAALGTAFAAKLWPAVLAPLVVVWLVRTRGPRAAAQWATAAVATAAAWFLPFVALSPAGVRVEGIDPRAVFHLRLAATYRLPSGALTRGFARRVDWRKRWRPRFGPPGSGSRRAT